MKRRRPTAAGLAAALGLPAPDTAPTASAPVADVTTEPPAPVAASPVHRRGRMGGVVVPAAAQAR